MDIFMIGNEETKKIPESLCRKLFPERMKRACRYVREEDKLMCMGAGILISYCLDISEREIFFSEYGKPYLKKDMYFNISHSGECAVLAFGNKEIGIDIEKIDDGNLKLMPYVFTENEREWIKEDPERFHIMWSIKESVMKATGLGMSLEPFSFEISPYKKSIFINGRNYFFDHGIFENKSFAVVCEDEIGEIFIKKVSSKDIMKKYDK